MRTASRLCAGILFLLISHYSFADERDMAEGLSDDQLVAVGREFADAVNSQDVDRLGRLVGVEQLGGRAAATLTVDAAQQAEYVQGFMANGSLVVSSLIDQLHAQGGTATYLRVRTFDGMRGPLVRYDLGDAGYNYLLLIAEPVTRRGAPEVVDIFLATSGQKLSDTIGAVSQLLVRPSDSMLERLFGRVVVDTDLNQTLVAIGNLQRSGDTPGAYKELSKLPEAVRNHRVILNLSVQLASLLDENLYRQELARLAEYHGDDPTTAFLLIDYYFYAGDTDAAMASIDKMETAFGADATLELLRASLLLAAGDTTTAIDHARKGIELEPDHEDVRWTLVTAFMVGERYADGIEALEGLEDRFGYAFDATSFEDNEIYAGFVRSPEFTAWMSDR
jgi:hypothetical protein